MQSDASCSLLFPNYSGLEKLDYVIEINLYMTLQRHDNLPVIFFISYNWPSLADRRKAVKLKNFKESINKESPVYLQELIPKRTGDVRPQSRNPDNCYPVKSRIGTFRQSFTPSSINLWNSLKSSDRTLTC